MTVSFFKASELENTGDTVRTYDLGVMSPARFLCATPVKVGGAVMTAWQILVNLLMMRSVEVEQTLVPATGFDPVTFRL